MQAEDWQAVLLLAIRLGVGPLLYQRLGPLQPVLNVPQPVSDRLRNHYLKSLAQGERLQRQVQEVLAALGARQIAVIPLKGISLVEKVYRDSGLRPMLDVDLLVRREQLLQAVEVLGGLGYKPATPIDVEEQCKVLHHLPGLYKAGTEHIELHWTLAPMTAPFRIPVETLWASAQAGSIAGVAVQELLPEDTLLHLCLHSAYLEAFSSGLRPVCDIAWCVESWGARIDWERLLLQAASWRGERSLALALRVAQKMLGVDIPQTVLQYFRDENAGAKFENPAIQQILQPVAIRNKLAQVWVPQPWHARTRRFFENIFPPAWEMKQAYPELTRGTGWLLAYAKHLILVVMRNWQVVWGLFSNNSALRAATTQRSRVDEMVRWQAGE